MTIQALEDLRYNYLSKNWSYEIKWFEDFNYKILENCICKKSHKKAKYSYNDITIMADTETSKAEFNQYIDIDYEDILHDIKYTRFKPFKDLKEFGTLKELKSYGFNFNGNTAIDVYYMDLQEKYPYIFKSDAFSEYEAFSYIFDYVINNKQEIDDRPHNHVVVWTLTIALFGINIVTLYGRKPSEMCLCLNRILNHLSGDKTFVYFHNLSYDWVFLRRFFFDAFGLPTNQLNVKSHYPINIEFENGLVLRDSLILAQRSLEKWAKDLSVKHQKAVGFWDYDLIRNQSTHLTDDELHYAEFDTLCGVECLDALKHQLKKDAGTLPYTSTGILRELIKKEGSKHDARKEFLKECPTFEQYVKMTHIYHGGYTHGNRHYLGLTLPYVKGFDFASSYPFVLFMKYPKGHFTPIANKSAKYILNKATEYAFMFKLCVRKPCLKSESIPMPYLQNSKCVYEINSLIDNGRIMEAEYVEIYYNEIDLQIFMKQYDFEWAVCTEVEFAIKDYLPRWFTDIVFSLFEDKTKLKGVDNVLYTLQKYKLNACYGLCCQRWDKPLINELESGDYEPDTSKSPEVLFNEYIKKRSTILNYSVGVWCTSYAVYNLFTLGSMCKVWLYSDTDSCYGLGWDLKAIQKYNNQCKDFMKKRGYGGVLHKGKMYHLGIAEGEPDLVYTEFRYLGAKRYAGRCKADNEIHITVAGVPKKNGASCLNNDISNFKAGFIFKGEKTGKLTHKHIYVDEIFTDENGNEVGDSIDLSPCDYLLNSVKSYNLMDWVENGVAEEITIQIADDTEDIHI